jgi:hypothetical protein
MAFGFLCKSAARQRHPINVLETLEIDNIGHSVCYEAGHRFRSTNHNDKFLPAFLNLLFRHPFGERQFSVIFPSAGKQEFRI